MWSPGIEGMDGRLKHLQWEGMSCLLKLRKTNGGIYPPKYPRATRIKQTSPPFLSVHGCTPPRVDSASRCSWDTMMRRYGNNTGYVRVPWNLVTHGNSTHLTIYSNHTHFHHPFHSVHRWSGVCVRRTAGIMDRRQLKRSIHGQWERAKNKRWK